MLRRLARLEAAAYVTAQRYPPDLVIKMHVTPEATVRRKTDGNVTEVKRRLGALQTLTYPFPTEVADVDADRSLAAVRRDVYRLVWDQI